MTCRRTLSTGGSGLEYDLAWVRFTWTFRPDAAVRSGCSRAWSASPNRLRGGRDAPTRTTTPRRLAPLRPHRLVGPARAPRVTCLALLQLRPLGHAAPGVGRSARPD